MSEFNVFYELGMSHILDLRGYDHILFIVALCALYQIEDWKKLLILVTAFTVGHSLTLALATFRLINIHSDLIEFLIPITIAITALVSIFMKDGSEASIKINYFFAGGFGLIHGLGFSNYLQSLLGRDAGIVRQLFAFNVGLEVGQLIIVAIFMAAGFLIVNIFGVARRDWRIVISSVIFGITIPLILQASYIN